MVYSVEVSCDNHTVWRIGLEIRLLDDYNKKHTNESIFREFRLIKEKKKYIRNYICGCYVNVARLIIKAHIIYLARQNYIPQTTKVKVLKKSDSFQLIT